jgi:preprotein translocase subunit YajC
MNSSGIITNIIFIILIAAMIVFMWMSSRKQRKQQQEEADWRQNLKPGEKVATVSGLLGEVVSADPDHDQITIKSGNSVTVWRIQAVRRPPVVPKYADEDDADAGNDKAEAADPATTKGIEGGADGSHVDSASSRPADATATDHTNENDKQAEAKADQPSFDDAHENDPQL